MTDETAPGPAPSIADCLRDGMLDADLAALLWILVEGRVPLLVAASEPAARAGEVLAVAIAGLVPPTVGRAALGTAGLEGDPARDSLLAGSLAGGSLRRAVRGAARGFGLVGRIAAGSLDVVLARLGDLAVGAGPEMIGRLGVVLVLGEEPPHRVVAAHYLRPTARDVGGHVRHLPPAVLATWDPGPGLWDHFAWGIYPELADRLDRRAGDLEREHAGRTEILERLAQAGVIARTDLEATLAHSRGHPGTDRGAT